MPAWLISLFVSLGVGVVLFLLNKLTFKTSADLAKSISTLEKEVAQLQKDNWTTDQRIELEKRLVRCDERISRLMEEVDFTKISHKEFLRLLEKALIPVAHSPHTPELDGLLEKRERGESLTIPEWKRILQLLDEEAVHYDDAPGKRIALRGLKAIYLSHLRATQRKEGISLNEPPRT